MGIHSAALIGAPFHCAFRPFPPSGVRRLKLAPFVDMESISI